MPSVDPMPFASPDESRFDVPEDAQEASFGGIGQDCELLPDIELSHLFCLCS